MEVNLYVLLRTETSAMESPKIFFPFLFGKKWADRNRLRVRAPTSHGSSRALFFFESHHPQMEIDKWENTLAGEMLLKFWTRSLFIEKNQKM